MSGGVGTSLGSNGRKGMRKIKVSGKRPGPVPEEPPPKINKKAQKAAGMEKARLSRERKTLDGLILGKSSQDKGLAGTVRNPQGRARGYFETMVFLTLFCSLYKEAGMNIDSHTWSATPAALFCYMSDCVRCVHNREGIDDPRVPIKTVTRRASDLLRASHGNSTLVVENFLTDGTVLVFDTANNGKGSVNYTDNARLLDIDQLKTIDDFIVETHQEGGSLSVRQIGDHLQEKHPDLYISNGAIRYALIHFLDYSWGEVKLRKCQTDPERMDVKRTYLVDYAATLKRQDEDETHINVYLDESYIHQNHAPKRSWCKFLTSGGAHINRGTGKGKRLIILVRAVILCHSYLLNLLTVGCCS
jgi:hypothetical protein